MNIRSMQALISLGEAATKGKQNRPKELSVPVKVLLGMGATLASIIVAPIAAE